MGALHSCSRSSLRQVGQRFYCRLHCDWDAQTQAFMQAQIISQYCNILPHSQHHYGNDIHTSCALHMLWWTILLAGQ